MKRIVIDARESGTTSGRYVDKLVEYLHKLQPPEYEFVLLAKEKRLEFLRGIAPNFEIIITPYKEFTFGEQLGFMQQIKRLHPDLVFYPFVQQPILYNGPVVTMMQDLTGIRFRNPAKNWLAFTIKQAVYKWVNKIAARKSVAVLTPTEFVRDDIAQYCGISPNKITVTLEAADKIADAPEPVPAGRAKQYIMYVGRPQPHKNLDRLVDAFAIAKQARPDLHLIFVGKTDVLFERLKASVAVKGIPDVLFTGFVSDGQLRWLYEHAAVYVFPSLSEGFGLPGLEAMHYGLPVASSNATCLPEVYQDAALYFDPENTQDMADKIGQILDDKRLAQSLAAKGAKLVKTYSWGRMTRQTLDIFDDVLKR